MINVKCTIKTQGDVKMAKKISLNDKLKEVIRPVCNCTGIENKMKRFYIRKKDGWVAMGYMCTICRKIQFNTIDKFFSGDKSLQ